MEPQTVQQALDATEAGKWIEALEKECKVLMRDNTCALPVAYNVPHRRSHNSRFCHKSFDECANQRSILFLSQELNS
jgi:hypothetical protein